MQTSQPPPAEGRPTTAEDRPYQSRDDQALGLIRARGLRAERFGRAWRIAGPGVDLLVHRLGSVSARDLVPEFD